jgi:hypothetical protein
VGTPPMVVDGARATYPPGAQPSGRTGRAWSLVAMQVRRTAEGAATVPNMTRRTLELAIGSLIVGVLVAGTAAATRAPRCTGWTGYSAGTCAAR